MVLVSRVCVAGVCYGIQSVFTCTIYDELIQSLHCRSSVILRLIGCLVLWSALGYFIFVSFTVVVGFGHVCFGHLHAYCCWGLCWAIWLHMHCCWVCDGFSCVGALYVLLLFIKSVLM